MRLPADGRSLAAAAGSVKTASALEYPRRAGYSPCFAPPTQEPAMRRLAAPLAALLVLALAAALRGAGAGRPWTALGSRPEVW